MSRLQHCHFKLNIRTPNEVYAKFCQNPAEYRSVQPALYSEWNLSIYQNFGVLSRPEGCCNCRPMALSCEDSVPLNMDPQHLEHARDCHHWGYPAEATKCCSMQKHWRKASVRSALNICSCSNASLDASALRCEMARLVQFSCTMHQSCTGYVCPAEFDLTQTCK